MNAPVRCRKVRASRWSKPLFDTSLRVLFMAGLTATPALAAPTCTIASGATLSFGAVVALASTGDVTTNSGTSLWVNCNSDVTGAPALYSATP
jgi:spore coat protein U-like protein